MYEGPRVPLYAIMCPRKFSLRVVVVVPSSRHTAGVHDNG